MTKKERFNFMVWQSVFVLIAAFTFFNSLNLGLVFVMTMLASGLCESRRSINVLAMSDIGKVVILISAVFDRDPLFSYRQSMAFVSGLVHFCLLLLCPLWILSLASGVVAVSLIFQGSSSKISAGEDATEMWILQTSQNQSS